MKRRLSLSAGMCALLVLGLLPGPVAARIPDRFSDLNVHKGVKVDASRLPSVQQANRQTQVYVQLVGRPVGASQGLAFDANPLAKFSESQKQALRAPLIARQNALKGPVANVGGKVMAQYTDVLNGFRVKIAGKNVARLAKLPGVLRVSPVRTFYRSNANTLAYTDTPQAWGTTGMTGAGVKVAVIDSGIDYFHRDFGGNGQVSGGVNSFQGNDPTVREPGTFPTAKVIGGWDLVGDAYNPSDTDPANDNPNPDPDPLDCQDPNTENVNHGTHVSGTAVGMGVKSDGTTFTGPYNASTLSTTNFKVAPGVAPRASLLSFRVFGCAGGTDLVVDAIEMAVRYDVDVINMSLGSSFGNGQSADDEAVNNATAAGVTVVASAGNSGPAGYITGSPAAANHAISVAALDANPSFPTAIIDMPGTQPDITAINANNSNAFPVTAPLEVLEDNAATPDNESLGCNVADFTTAPNNAAGKIAVVNRGTCARVLKAQNGQAAGAVAVIMVNNAPSFPPFEGPIPGVTIPFLGVPSTDGPALKAADGQTVTLRKGPVMANPAYKFMANFTSGGPRRRDDVLKPDVTAPGVSTISAAAGTGNDGKSLSGTSMASPAVAGMAALVVQAHPTWRPSAIKGAIVGTALPLLSKIKDYSVRISGNGAANSLRAVQTQAYPYVLGGEGSLSFHYQQLSGAWSETRSFRIINNGSSPITYNVSTDMDPTRYDSFGATATVSPKTITVGANSQGVVSLTLSMSAAAVAALPDAAALAFVPAMVTGVVVMKPTTLTSSKQLLRMRFGMTPRGVSRINPSAKTAYTNSGNFSSTRITVKNYGIHRGTADVYTWGLLDGNEGYESNDIRAVGLASVRGDFSDPQVGGTANDVLLVWAINTWGRWSNAAINEFDINVDTRNCTTAEAAQGCANEDPEFVVVAVDCGLLTTGDFEGHMCTATFTADFSAGFIVAEITPPTNGSTLNVLTLASFIGLSAKGDRDFYYYANSIAYLDYSAGEGNDFAGNGSGNTTGRYRFSRYDVFNPVLSSGDSAALNPGESARLTLTVDRTRYDRRFMKGWMIVNMDDPNGADQADLIQADPVPAP